MRLAQIDNQLIRLCSDTYENIAEWRFLADQGKIVCPACRGRLRLVAGISDAPRFIHAAPTTCSGYAETIVQRQSPAQAETAAAAEPKAAPYSRRLIPRHTVPGDTRLEEDTYHPMQWQAITTTEGPLLILAGAGSGKTRVMAARTAYLIREKRADPRSIMVVTFTTKAAEEIRRRLAARLSSSQAASLIAGTFHGLFYRILCYHDPQVWDQRHLLKQDWQKARLLRESGLLDSLDACPGEADLLAALAVISRWKNECLMPDDLAGCPPSLDEEKLAHELYPLYEQAKRRGGWFDFDDMLLGCYHLLRDQPQIRKQYQTRITHIMIDEFQDINRVQYETVKMLAAPQNNLCVIGDDDQSIYGFRGSDPQYILGFTRDYPDARSITLDVNYRSRSSIVSLGCSLIGNNRTRWKKDLKGYHQEEGDCYLFHPEDEEEQAARITDEITTLLEAGMIPGEIAILFRTYESSRPILEHLMKAGIPFSYFREGEPFYQRQAVRWALGYLRLALHPDDHDALRDILPTLYIAADQWNTIRSQAILHDTTVLDALPALPDLKGFQRKHLEQVVSVLRHLPACSPKQALELIYEDLKLRDYVKKRSKDRPGGADERAADDLRQLLSAAKRHATIGAFLVHLEEAARWEREIYSKGAVPPDAVQVMSIHRAKGLEFDTVFLADLIEGVLPHEYALEQLRRHNPSALEEERRLMYVAITRARHKLFLGVPRERFGRQTKMSRFVAEMERAEQQSARLKREQ
ncbi:MAG: ATP-dependent helicase [Brevibacillus sp.]|nr:ATP-dependent helicase [Brevibacillus sp.]